MPVNPQANPMTQLILLLRDYLRADARIMAIPRMQANHIQVWDEPFEQTEDDKEGTNDGAPWLYVVPLNSPGRPLATSGVSDTIRVFQIRWRAGSMSTLDVTAFEWAIFCALVTLIQNSRTILAALNTLGKIADLSIDSIDCAVSSDPAREPAGDPEEWTDSYDLTFRMSIPRAELVAWTGA